jgi:hypothetical protein
MKEIKDTIRDFVNFDINGNYYNKDAKEDIVRYFKKIIFEDEATVRKFLESFFDQTKKLADEFGLIAKDEDVKKEDSDEEEEDKEELPTEEKSEDTEKETTAEQPKESDEEESASEETVKKAALAPESIQRDDNKLFEQYTESADFYLE